jgi:hypothetical protein
MTLQRDLNGEEILYEPYIMDHPIECPKCGSVDRYEMTFQAHARITSPDMISFILNQERPGKRSKHRDNPRIFFIRTSIFGVEMHPLEGLDRYRERIALDPKNAELFVRMGNLLRSILRYDQALEAHRRAVELLEDDPEVLLAAAASEHDLGDSELAAQHYQKIIQMDLERSKGEKQVPNNVFGRAVKGLAALKNNQSSPNDFHFTTQSGRKVIHPSLTLKNWRPSQAQPSSSPPKKKTKRGHRKKK